MLLASLLRARDWGRRTRSDRGRRPARRLQLEALEDRMLPSYTFALLEQTGSAFTGLPGGQAINDAGQVAFEANLPNGNEAIYRREHDGSLTTIATIDAPSTIVLAPYMNDAGQVTFEVQRIDGSRAIFRGDGNDLTPIADTGPTSPFSSFPNPVPQISDLGAVYFRATLKSGGAGLFSGDGTNLTTLYQTGGQFSAFLNSPNIQRHGDEFAFRAILSGGPECVCSGSGGPVTIVATAGTTYSTFLSNTNNDKGEVVFTAKLTAGGEAVVTPAGFLADTSGPYSQFFAGQLTLNNRGTVVFGADLTAGGHGVFKGPDAAADKIIATGDPLFGSTVKSFPDNFLNNRGLNEAGRIVFRANLADGRTVLAVAEPDDANAQPGSNLQVSSSASGTNPGGLESALLGTTGPGQWASLGTSLLSNPGIGAGDAVWSTANTQQPAAVPSLSGQKDLLWGEAVGQQSAAVPASSGQSPGGVHERVFAEFGDDWLSGALWTNLAIDG